MTDFPMAGWFSYGRFSVLEVGRGRGMEGEITLQDSQKF